MVTLYVIHTSRLIEELLEDFAKNASATNALECLQRCLSSTDDQNRGPSPRLQEILNTICDGKQLKSKKLKEERNAQYDLFNSFSCDR